MNVDVEWAITWAYPNDDDRRKKSVYVKKKKQKMLHDDDNTYWNELWARFSTKS